VRRGVANLVVQDSEIAIDAVGDVDAVPLLDGDGLEEVVEVVEVVRRTEPGRRQGGDPEGTRREAAEGGYRK